MKYNLGTTQIRDSSGNWGYAKGMWVNQSGTWVPIKTGWVCTSAGVWERIYPTPNGVLTLSQTSITNSVYQHQYNNPNTIIFANTGDFDVVINSITYNDSSGNFSTTVVQDLASTTITPGNSENLILRVFGTTIGSYSGSIVISYNTGYLGDTTLTIPVTTTVLQDYAAVSSSVQSMSFTIIAGENTKTYAYTNLGNNSYTVPSGIARVNINMAGGGGGGGAQDSHGGANGIGGNNLNGVLNVSSGQTLNIHIGGGGAAGASGSHNYIAPGGYSDDGFGGGNGGPSGYDGWSGSGGGGGAGTTLYKCGTLYAVAGGGGGGGGGGNYSYGQGQYVNPNGSSHTGANGGDRGGSDGGGPGGGGGGYPGGAAGPIAGGDNGSYTGSNGYNLLPDGWVVTNAGNGGAANANKGSNGSASLTEYGPDTPRAQTVTIQNAGTGADLTISAITSKNNYLTFTDVPTTIGYNFSTFTGNTATFTVIPYTLPSSGEYTDTIQIHSNAVNGSSGVYSIPVTISVRLPSWL